MEHIIETLWPMTVILVALLGYSAYIKTITKQKVDDLSQVKEKLLEIDAKVSDLSLSKTIGRF